jgi:hypothetical protein
MPSGVVYRAPRCTPAAWLPPNVEHPTSNIQRSNKMPCIEVGADLRAVLGFDIRRSVFDVRCSMFARDPITRAVCG